MQMNLEKTAGSCRLALSEAVTIYHALTLRDALVSALDDADEVVIDLRAVTEIDSAGMQLLDAAVREASRRGKTLACVNPSETVLSVLTLLRRTDLIEAPARKAATKRKGKKNSKEVARES